jgi:hypothetical protein
MPNHLKTDKYKIQSNDLSMRNLSQEERIVLDQLMLQKTQFKRKPVFKKDATNLRVKESQYKDLSTALDLLLEGPNKKHFEELNGQHELFK